MSFNDELAEHDTFKPQQYAVPLDGRPRQCRLCPVSQKQRVRRTPDRVCIVPSDKFQRHHQSEPRSCRLFSKLRRMSYKLDVAGCDVQPQQYAVPLNRRSYQCRLLCPVSQKQPVCRTPDCVHLLPSDGFQRHDESESRVGGISAGLQPVSFNDELAGRTFNHNTATKFPLDRGSYQCLSLCPVS